MHLAPERQSRNGLSNSKEVFAPRPRRSTPGEFKLRMMLVSADETRSAVALVASMLLHAIASVGILLVVARMPESSRLPPVDRWRGDTFEIAEVVSDSSRDSAKAKDDSEEPPQEEPTTPPARPIPKVNAARGLPMEPAVVQKPPDEVPTDYDDAEDWLGEPGELADEEPRPRDDPEPDAPPKRAAPEPSLLEKVYSYEPHARDEDDADDVSRSAAPATFGGSDEPGAPRNLARAFTRAIPAANTTDSAWTTLPLGDAGKAWVTIVVDEDGKIMEVEPREPLEPYFERLIERTVAALRAGRFVLEPSSAGEQSFELNVVISQRPRGQGPLELGFDAPRSPHPGRAYFQLNSGRFVEVFVSPE